MRPTRPGRGGEEEIRERRTLKEMEGVGIIVLNYRMTERLKVDSWQRKYCTGEYVVRTYIGG